MKESNETILLSNDQLSRISNSRRLIKRREVCLKKDEVEKKLFDVFPTLKDDSKFHDLFSSYDFHENEAFMIHFWKDLLEHLIIYLNDNFCINYGHMISLTRFKYVTPIGLPNVVKKLIKDGDLLLASDLKNDEYYKKNFPNLYPKETWGQYFKKSIVNSLWGTTSIEDREIQNDDLLIEKKSFLVNTSFTKSINFY